MKSLHRLRPPLQMEDAPVSFPACVWALYPEPREASFAEDFRRAVFGPAPAPATCPTGSAAKGGAL